ncbi:Translin family-domain-containing protein [Butyriboletus roseoflavus]|nr:Translin family-domain-containing protein [Butyriboletus roseoflavus]
MPFQPIFTQFQHELDDHNDRRERLVKVNPHGTPCTKITTLSVVGIGNSRCNHPLEKGHLPPAPYHARGRARYPGTFRARIQTRKYKANASGAIIIPSPQVYKSRCPPVYTLSYPSNDVLHPDTSRRSASLIISAMAPWSPLAKYKLPCRTTMAFLYVGDITYLIRVPSAISSQYLPLPKEDYLLGLADLTGELMRFAISGFSRKGGRARAVQVCNFVRDCKSGMYFLSTTYCPRLTSHQDFDRFTPFVKGLRKKQVVTNQSLEKIEHAVYAIVVRTSEYDLPPEILDDIITQSMSNHAHKDKRSNRDIGSDDERDYDY